MLSMPAKAPPDNQFNMCFRMLAMLDSWMSSSVCQNVSQHHEGSMALTERRQRGQRCPSRLVQPTSMDRLKAWNRLSSNTQNYTKLMKRMKTRHRAPRQISMWKQTAPGALLPQLSFLVRQLQPQLQLSFLQLQFPFGALPSCQGASSRCQGNQLPSEQE